MIKQQNDIKIAIAIQARLGSTRCPNKAIEKLSPTGTSAITSLIHNCTFCQSHVKAKKLDKTKVDIDIWVLVPDNEIEFWNEFLAHKNVSIMAGHPTNVLSRYIDLSQYNYDYIMRLTGDCPNVPAIAMNKAIYTAIFHNLDYCSNVWEEFRTCPDGHDIEIMSAKAMNWLATNATTKEHFEHVTIAIRTLNSKVLKRCCLINKEDLSHIKLCIDTPEELEAARSRFTSAYRKKKLANEMGLFTNDY